LTRRHHKKSKNPKHFKVFRVFYDKRIFKMIAFLGAEHSVINNISPASRYRDTISFYESKKNILSRAITGQLIEFF
jgi:hypothetical protein